MTPTQSDQSAAEERTLEVGQFLGALAGMSPDDALAAIVVEMAWTRKEHDDIHKEMGDLPRSQKALARELAIRAQRCISYRKGLDRSRRHYQDLIERRDRHSLWKEAVTEVCGAEALQAVFAYMSTKRKQPA
jgi:DNA gyrase/topoisomerase IV subunit A